MPFQKRSLNMIRPLSATSSRWISEDIFLGVHSQTFRSVQNYGSAVIPFRDWLLLLAKATMPRDISCLTGTGHDDFLPSSFSPAHAAGAGRSGFFGTRLVLLQCPPICGRSERLSA